MDKETDNFEEEQDDFDIDELLAEDEDSPVEEVTEEVVEEPRKKGRGRPKGITKKKEVPEVPVEVAETQKDLQAMKWQILSQAAFEGYQNVKTGEIISEKEAIRRTLCYAQEAAYNSR